LKNWLKKLNKKYVVRKSEEESMGNKMLLSIVMALGIATFAYFVSSHIIMNRAKSQFENDTQEIVNQINNEVNRYKDLAYSVRSYIANTDQLDKDGFHRYVVSLDFKKFPSLHALNFAQSVFDNELDDYYRHLKIEYENSADTENLNNTILQKLNSKKIVHIKNSEHFIINYFEPNKQGIDFIGKDLSEIPSAKQSLIDGRVNKEVNSTGNLFVGHYEPKDILAAFFRLAVFDQHNPELYRGSIGIGIKLDKSLFGNKNDKYINYRIKASNQSMSQASMVFDSKMPDKNLTEKWSTEPNTSEKLFSIKKPLNLANSNFELYAYTDKMPPNVASINSAYILSVFMFLLSLFLIRRWFTLETDKGRAHKMAERMTQEIRVTAFSDNLTGLANRKCFLDDLNECIEKYPEETLYVMFLDLDGFKKVNDTLGHAAGDVVLKNFAIRLQELAQSEPVKCYRIGGDEFTILLETRLSPIKFKKTHLEELAKNLLLLTKQSFSVSGEDFFLSVSIGIAEYPFDGASAKELFKNSDVAMYETKKRGKNNYVFYSKELSSNLEKKNQMENLLLTAFDKNEFYIVYQPKLERK
jgi:diguanylate cyclase (GGDEF)-like protein